ncbi:BlaI/MecI/CopY family transcriptional regulator [Frankia sp. CNm7]|nr:BlaI/MecI/CopY family transcriptional regulator [Frankia nepalensis]MBL7515575.1 BlaI/MecI/CopY family transcriptional regulator [Frankia nepalensis]MBL7524664.1 BlaI/MecI/CopY family transcriptional regulator [Frankia nepalensis]
MHGLGALEAAVMDLLWSASEPRTVRAVVDELQQRRQIAYTTVMTVMDNLHRKGWLRRELVGRAYLYEPVRSQEEHSAELMGEALAHSLDPATTLIHFVERISPGEARLLRTALTRATRGAGTQGFREDASRPGQRHQPSDGPT